MTNGPQFVAPEKPKKTRTVTVVISGPEFFVKHTTDVLREFVQSAAKLGNLFEDGACSTVFDFVDGVQ